MSIVKLVLFLCFAMPAASANAQTSEAQTRKAYGSRVGDREQDPNNAGLTGDRRANKRVNSRIDSRLNTRIDRFVAPQADDKNAYTPRVDDGTKSKAKP